MKLELRDTTRGNVVYLDTFRKLGSVAEAVVKQIETEFGDAAKINRFKARINGLLKLGIMHPAFRARYGRRAELLWGLTLNRAITTVERMYHDERKSLLLAAALGRGSPFALDVLRELRLMLRWLRASKHADAVVLRRGFPTIVRTVAGMDEETLTAAE